MWFTISIDPPPPDGVGDGVGTGAGVGAGIDIEMPIDLEANTVLLVGAKKNCQLLKLKQ